MQNIEIKYFRAHSRLLVVVLLTTSSWAFTGCNFQGLSSMGQSATSFSSTATPSNGGASANPVGGGPSNPNPSASNNPGSPTGAMSTAVPAVAVGGGHTCALMAQGIVYCWGNNEYDQLGDGSSANSFVPVQVAGLTGVTQISAGTDHTCALMNSGTVECWGVNAQGELGNGSNVNSGIPVPVTGLTGVIAIAAGAVHTCALTKLGLVFCWGENPYGQLGNGTTAEGTTPVQVKGINGGITAISAGDGHSCALTTQGSVMCWGSNSFGQLGNNSTTNSNVPVAVTGLSGVTAISAGGLHTCAILKGGAVDCWGSNLDGELGVGVLSTDSSLVPIPLAGLTGVVGLAMGSWHSCALLADASVDCWGENTFGQVGNSTPYAVLKPTPVAGASGVGEISAGVDATCVLIAKYAIECWGDGSLGNLGDNGVTNSSTPMLIGNFGSNLDGGSPGFDPTNIVSIATGDHGCAVTKQGAVLCWGGTLQDSQAGNGAGVTGITSGATSVAVGIEHSCALTSQGTVMCWGRNLYGELGNNGPNTLETGNPVQVTGLSGVSQIAAGAFFTCALTSQGTVMCWGSGIDGELGNGAIADSFVPTQVSGLTGITAISAGPDFACALSNQGTVYCWGGNLYGQLGSNVGRFSSVPVGVAGLTSVVGVSAGGVQIYNDTQGDSGIEVSHVCALTQQGTVFCWGYNMDGELGNNSKVNSVTPVQVTGLSGIVAVSVGYHHTCATNSQGVVLCWGDNSQGELGEGHSAPGLALTPVPMTGISKKVAFVIAGNDVTYLIYSDGTVAGTGQIAPYTAVPAVLRFP